MANTDNLSSFFDPASVAIFGSISSPRAPGSVTIMHLQKFGFKGKIYPISTSCDQVLGIKTYPDLEQVPGPIDVAIIVIPPAAVAGVVEKCACKGIRSIVIMTENFAEAGDDGLPMQKQLVDIARRAGIRIIGPNTVGILSTSSGFITTPYLMYYDSVIKGSISYCCQSGLMANVVHPFEQLAYPVSKLCDWGNKCDLNEVDLLHYLGEDPSTDVICMHLEDIKDGRAFIEAARKAVAKKPVLVFKPGRSPAGAKASASHTGSLAGNDQVIDAAFRQAGVIRLNRWQEYWDVPRIFASQPLPRGNRVGFLVASGGAGVIGSDAAVAAGLEVASYSKTTLDKLAEISPRMARNPIDIGPLITVSTEPLLVPEQVFKIVMADENIDCLAIMSDWVLMEWQHEPMEKLRKMVLETGKPVSVFIYGSRMDKREELVRQFTARGIPTFLDPETAVKALGVAVEYARIRERINHM